LGVRHRHERVADHDRRIDTATNTVTTNITDTLRGQFGGGSFPQGIAIVAPRQAADLAVSVADSADPVALGDTYTSVQTVTDAGPTPATGVTTNLILSGTANLMALAMSCESGRIGPISYVMVSVIVADWVGIPVVRHCSTLSWVVTFARVAVRPAP
jgi:hypothetical protein